MQNAWQTGSRNKIVFAITMGVSLCYPPNFDSASVSPPCDRDGGTDPVPSLEAELKGGRLCRPSFHLSPRKSRVLL